MSCWQDHGSGGKLNVAEITASQGHHFGAAGSVARPRWHPNWQIGDVRRSTFWRARSCNYRGLTLEDSMTPGDHSDVLDTQDVDGSFEDFVKGSSMRLFTMALLLTGYQRAEAEDLLQGVLERTYRRWRRISLRGDPEPYVRQMLINASVDRWRLLRRRSDEPLFVVRAQSTTGDQAAEIAERDQLLRALATLPAGQRAVLGLRYLCDLSEAQTAAVLACSVGSVKSQSSRALARLRQIVEPTSESSGQTSAAERLESS